MTTDTDTEEFDEEPEEEDFNEDAIEIDGEDVELDDALEIDDEIDPDVDIEDGVVADVTDDDFADDVETPAVEGDDDEETAEALDELEAEELELLDDEVGEALLVDEAAELRAIRREELTLNVGAQSQRSDEFVCSSCFLVKRMSQVANRRKMLCFDCVE
ncbi:hypothetical protein BH23ACT5_BH23ACT5_10740 [soil metagenome]